MNRIAYECRVKTFKCIYLIFIRQLLLYWHNRAELLHSISFLIISSITCQLTQNILSTNLLLVLLLFSLMLSFDALLLGDYRNNMIEQFWLFGVSTELILLSKVLSHVVAISLPFSLFITIFSHIAAIDGIHAVNFLVIAILLSMNITLIGLFSTAICLHCNQKNVMLVISMPFTMPAMIFASLSLHDSSYLGMMSALLLFGLPVFLISSSAVIKSILRYR